MLGITAVACAVGLFRGLSGTLAFFMATLAAVSVALFGWPVARAYFAAKPLAAASVAGACLLSFGLVRIIIKKTVNGLLAQPSDALFGMLVGLAIGALLTGVWALTGLGLAYSHLAGVVAKLLPPGLAGI